MCIRDSNWNKIGNFTKMSIPMALILLGIIGWFIFQNKKSYRELSLFSSSFFIGTLFAVFGQIYQTGEMCIRDRHRGLIVQESHLISKYIKF